MTVRNDRIHAGRGRDVHALLSVSDSEQFWAALPLGRDVELIVRDRNGLAAFNKPAGVLSHPNERGDEPRSLLHCALRTRRRILRVERTPGRRTRAQPSLAAQPARFGDVGRDPRGGERGARDRDSRAVQAQAGAQRSITRSSSVRRARPSELWRDLLAVEKRGGQIRTDARAGHVPAESRMTVVRTGASEPRLTLIQLEPTHRPQSSAARAVREAPAADRRRPDLRRLRAQPRVRQSDGHEAAVPALAGPRLSSTSSGGTASHVLGARRRCRTSSRSSFDRRVGMAGMFEFCGSLGAAPS